MKTDLSDLVELFGTDAFERQLALYIFVLTADLPLEEFCEGGMPTKITGIDLVEQTDRGDDLFVRAHVSFEASYPSSCPSMNRDETELAFLEITIPKAGGEASIVAEQSEVEEF